MPSRPLTPLHPDANQEIEVPGDSIPQELTSALDFDSDDDSDGEVLSEEEAVGEARAPSTPYREEESSPESPGPSCATDFFDIDNQRRRAPVNPFGENSQLASSNPIAIVRRRASGSQPRRLSLNQQSRFVNYVDERLMGIQRQFIRYLSVREDPAEEAELTLQGLVAQLGEVVNIIWYSVYKEKQIPFVYHENILTPAEQEQHTVSSLEPPAPVFGQTNYLLKIMDDLVDYLDKFAFRSFDDMHAVLVLVAELDNFVSILVDEKESQQRAFISNTEKIRMDSIIGRTKMVVVRLFDEFKHLLGSQDVSGLKKPIQQYEQLFGEIYEGVLDRTSI